MTVSQKALSAMNIGFEHLGGFHMSWSTFDIIIELSITKLINIDFEKANLLLHGMSFSRKFSILKSLLYLKDPKHEVITLLNEFQSLAKRNTIVHGMLGWHDESLQFTMRESSNRFKVKKVTLKNDEMRALVAKMVELASDLQSKMSIDNEDFDNYAIAADKLATKSAKLP